MPSTRCSLVLGEFDPREIEEANPDVGKTIFLLFMFFFFFAAVRRQLTGTRASLRAKQRANPALFR